MPPSTQVRQLADRILAEIERASHFSQLTRVTWGLTEDLIKKGEKVRYTREDGTNIEVSQELAEKARDYATIDLPKTILQTYVALFEDYLKGLMTIWLTTHPKGLRGLVDDPGDDRAARSDRTVPLDLILDNADRETILSAIIEREIDRLSYRRLSAWFKYLNDRVVLGCPSADEIATLAEIKASRDLLVHNRGIVNRTYLDKAGTKSRFDENLRIEVSWPYLEESRILIRKVVEETSQAAIAKLG